jgi:hypothetical protein
LVAVITDVVGEGKPVVASVFALAGIVIMVGPDALTGHLGGALLAFVMTSSMALMIVIVRVKKSVSMLPASCPFAYLSSRRRRPVANWPCYSERLTPAKSSEAYLGEPPSDSYSSI